MNPPSHSFAILSNAALVVRCQSHDEDAFAELFSRHRQMIYRVCLRYLGHHHDAEDVTQETFRRAAQAMPRVDSQRPLEPWLLTIAANRCRSFLVRRQKDRLVSRLDDASSPPPTHPDNTHRLALGEQIEHALERLPQHQRQAFELVHRSELSYPEAASMLGRSTGTVKTWVYRARLAMQDTLRRTSAADTAACSTAPESTSSARPQRLASRYIVSAMILACFCIGGQFEMDRIPLAGRHHSSPALVPDTAAAIPLHREAQSDVANEPSAALKLEPSKPQSVDWQLVSLSCFSQVQFSVDQIRALPVRQWVQRTAPTLDRLHSGIEPLRSTLQRAVHLFQCDLASTEHAGLEGNSQAMRDPVT